MVRWIIFKIEAKFPHPKGLPIDRRSTRLTGFHEGGIHLPSAGNEKQECSTGEKSNVHHLRKYDFKRGVLWDRFPYSAMFYIMLACAFGKVRACA